MNYLNFCWDKIQKSHSVNWELINASEEEIRKLKKYEKNVNKFSYSVILAGSIHLKQIIDLKEMESRIEIVRKPEL